MPYLNRSKLRGIKPDFRINENLYYPGMPGAQKNDLNYYDQPAVTGGTTTRNEIQHLTTGDEYKFSLLPTEVVTMNIVSADGNDVEIIVRQYGKEKKHTVKGTDKIGLFIAFQNR